jgi:uncharacterized protein YbbC (DUF1343 family)
MFQKHAGTVCEGVELHITDRETYSPIETMLCLYRHMRSYPEFEARREGLSLRFGSDMLWDDYDISAFKKKNAEQLKDYWSAVKPYLIYPI